MSFSAADLVATIQLGGVATANRDLDRFHEKLNNADSVASKLGKTAEATFRGAATSIGVASVAAAAYVTSLFRTGVAYNQLQQTSRAALKTLVGGTEQANAQMDKLDAFAKTSPFSKAVFITAQQQLIGFGMEAKKVIPTLDAMQDAVAATGGSSQQLGDLVFILAQIQAAGKITGQDLLQFGQRGVNAAELIGSQMGMTGAQIKKEISEGTLDAGKAIDALVVGMKQKFGGAAAGVKETFSGTLDRIHAASRDIGAALAEPFVSKNGGGLAVTWGNQVADVMRAVEAQVGPVVTILTRKAMPAFNDFTLLLDRARVQVKSWDPSRLERGFEAIAGNAPGLAALAGAVLGVNSQLLASIPIVGRFVPAFGPLPGAIAAAALASPQLRTELGALLGELQPLVPVTVSLATTMSGMLNAALPVVASGIRLVTSVAGPLVDMISDIPSPMLATAAAAVGVYVAMRSASPALQGFVDNIRRIGEQAAVQAALAGMEGNTGKFAGTLGVAGKAVSGFGNSLKAAFISNPVGLIILGVSTAAAILTAALGDQAEKAKETKERIAGYRDVLDQTTGALTGLSRAQVEKNLEDTKARQYAKELKLSYRDVVDASLGNEAAYKKVTAAQTKYNDASYEAFKRNETHTVSTVRLTEEVDKQKSAIKAAADANRRAAREAREVAAAMSEADRSNSRLNEALGIARDVSRDATERLRALKQALDELNGGTKTQAELTRDLNEQGDRLKEVFGAVDANGNGLAKSLVNAAGVIDTTTAAGRGLFDETKRLNDQMLDAILAEDKLAKARGDAGVSTQRAAQVAQPYIDRLREIATQSGLSQEQVDGLVQTMLNTPQVVAFLVNDNGTISVKQQELLTLAQNILATPSKEFEVSSDDFPGLYQALAALGVDIRSLPAGQVKVRKDDGSFISMEQALNTLTRNRVVRITTSGTVKYGGKEITPGMATGGPVRGPGTGTSDTAGLFRLSNGEHVATAQEVQAAGGHEGMYRIRQALLKGGVAGLAALFPGRAAGGPIYPVRSVGESMLPVASPVMSAPVGLGAAGLDALIAEIRALRESLGRPNISLTGDIEKDWWRAIRDLRDESGGVS